MPGKDRMRRRALASLVVAGALAVGLAACGDDEGDTGTGPDETATAEFCSSLSDLSMVLDDAEAATSSTSATELQEINSALGGAADSVNLAAQGAGVNTDQLLASVQSLQPRINAVTDDQSQQSLAALKSSLDPVSEEVATLEDANCQGEAASGA